MLSAKMPVSRKSDNGPVSDLGRLISLVLVRRTAAMPRFVIELTLSILGDDERQSVSYCSGG
jgi:hypothetical protein